MNAASYDNSEVIGTSFPVFFYSTHLSTIQEIPFTSREIDVIACILSGRSVKKIASFLRISPRTVETHIRNILLKINGQTQGNIIDFVEHSDKFKLIRQYYSNLLIHSFFIEELTLISKEIKEEKTICLMIQNSNVITSFIDQVERLLILTGLKINRISLNDKSLDSLLKKSEFKHFEFLLVYVSTSSAISDQSLLKIYSKKFEDWQNIETISINERCNHYFLFFEILETIFLEGQIKSHFVKFKQKYDTVIEPSSFTSLYKDNFSPTLSIDNNRYNKSNYNRDKPLKHKKLLQNNKGLLLLFGMVIISCFLYLFQRVTNKDVIIPNQNRNAQFSSNATRGSTKLSMTVAKKIEEGKYATWNLPRQDNKFIGRKDLLLKIEQALQAAYSVQEKNKNLTIKNSALITVCAGLGGVGKTQLALHYIHHIRHPYTLRAWFYSESKELLKTQYIEFSKELGLKEKDPSFETACTYVKDWLAEHPGWLLVYDNVTNYEDIKDFLPNHGGSIILTTRSQRWPNTFKAFDIEVMNESEAIELISTLVKNPNISHNQEKNELKELVKRLGYLPLALAQAGAYIDQDSLSISDYLKLYNRQERELLQDNSKPEGTDSLPVATTWNISLEAIAKENQALHQSPSALSLLMICAYLAPDKIPRMLLEIWLQENHPTVSPLLLTKLIEQLRRYSMISINDDDSISVHRLVQSVLRQQHNEFSTKFKPYITHLNMKWYNSLLKAFEKMFWMKNDNFYDEKLFQLQMLPHLQSLVKHYNTLWPNLDSIEYGNMLYNIAHILRIHLSELQSSKNYYDKSLIIHRKHSLKDTVDIAEILAALGVLHWDIGDNNESKKLLSQALNIIDAENGEYSLAKIRILHGLASAYIRSGEFTTARNFLESALNLSKAHATTGKSRINVERIIVFTKLGITLVNLGNMLSAKENLHQAIKIAEQQYGTDHHLLFDASYHLAYLYILEGNYIKAREILEDLLKRREEYYGNNHRLVGTVLNHLGYCYTKCGDLTQGIKLLKRAYEISNKISGPTHVHTGTALKYLGESYIELKDFEQAKNLLVRALDIGEKYYHAGDAYVANILVILTELYLQLQDTNKAKDCLDRALLIKENNFSKHSPEIAKAQLVQAKFYINTHQLHLAKPLILNCYQIFLKEYGENSYFTKQALILRKRLNRAPEA